jgi:hypothetical protein
LLGCIVLRGGGGWSIDWLPLDVDGESSREYHVCCRVAVRDVLGSVLVRLGCFVGLADGGDGVPGLWKRLMIWTCCPG